MAKKKRNKKGFMSLTKAKWVAPDGIEYDYTINRKTGAKYGLPFRFIFRQNVETLLKAKGLEVESLKRFPGVIEMIELMEHGNW